MLKIRLCLAAAIVVFMLNSCEEFGANAVDGSGLKLTEGSVLTYDDLGQFDFRPFPAVSDKRQMKLLSTIATIGGRNKVRAFESSVDRSIHFIDHRDGRVWHFFQANQEFERSLNHQGLWVRIPIDDEAEVSGVIQDQVYFDDPEFANPVTRRLRVKPAGSYRFYAGGYHFSARKVRVESEYFTTGNEGFAHTITEEITYLDDLGAIAEQNTTSLFGSESKIVLSKLEIK